MEALFGIVGKDFVLVAADQTAGRSIIVLKSTENKTRQLNDNIVMAYSGDPGDTVNFAEFIQRNVQYYGICNEVPLTTRATANFTRTELAKSVRSRKPYSVNLLIAGCDERNGPELYWMDYFGALQKLNFAAHGYAAHLNLGLLDRHYKKNLDLPAAKELLAKCFRELKVRFIVNLPKFTVKLITKDGIKDIDIDI